MHLTYQNRFVSLPFKRNRTIYFHGEVNVEIRSAVIDSLKESLKDNINIMVLQKCISNYVCVRPGNPGQPWSPCCSEYFVHHKSWRLIQDAEVLPLISKRRTEVEKFFLLHSDSRRRVFAKFLEVGESLSSGNEQASAWNSMNIVIYQVLSRADGIFVDIHMEACRSIFNPFHLKHDSTAFNRIYEMIIAKDTDCAKNIRSRSNLLAALRQGTSELTSAFHTKQVEDVLRFVRLSTHTKTELRFFNTVGSGSANKLLGRLTTQRITSETFPTRATMLSIDEHVPILSFSGTWFIMRVDRYVLSVVCLEDHDQYQKEADSLQYFRPLSFFTAGIADLYPNDDDFDVIRLGEDHLRLSQIVEVDHAKNFARACYWALLDTVDPITWLHNDDVEYALSALTFRDCLTTFISAGDLSAESVDTGIRLWAVIGNLLRVVPGSNDQLFFFYGDDYGTGVSPSSIAPQSGVDRSFYDSQDDVGETSKLIDEREIKQQRPTFDNPPLFFRFILDGELATLSDILTLNKCANLAAQVSVFISSDGILPQSHVASVSKLHTVLNSFAAEQKLQKYRFMRRSLTEEILRDVMLNLPMTQHKSCEMVLEFFSTKSDSLVPANDSAGSCEKGFKTLLNELERSIFTRIGQEIFLADDTSASMDVLPYWCFVQVRKPLGRIVFHVHHPLGDDAAEEQLRVTQKLVKKLCDRTNRLLLLDSLINSKNASSLLICEDDDEKEVLDVGRESKFVADYSCPVQHTTSIPLHRRCAPQQAILALETTILQNFIVSNRRGIFVYKDELENVFYMKLMWFKVPDAKDTDRNPHIIELSVYGCDKPGPSITDHLVCLLKRKLLSFTLDALSSLLKKNPW